MNPIYKFELTAQGYGAIVCRPVWKSDLAKEYSKESQQIFFREKFSGKITFIAADFDYIIQKPLDTRFRVAVNISYDMGESWQLYLRGVFWKTDCEFNLDARTCIVTPSADDDYTAVLDGVEKEFNLIDLAPAIVPITYDKRPAIQIYAQGASSVGVFLGGMWWEQEVLEPASTSDIIEDRCHFKYWKRIFFFVVSGNPDVPDAFWGPRSAGDTTVYTNGDTTLTMFYIGGSGGHYALRLEQDGKQWLLDDPDSLSGQMQPVPGTGATGTLTIETTAQTYYARMLCDVDEVQGVSTFDLPENDIVGNNRNYHKCIGYTGEDLLVFTPRKSTTPTKYGIYQPGIYYDTPAVPSYLGEFYPYDHKSWGYFSAWYLPNALSAVVERSGRAPYTLNDSYSLGSVIAVLLRQIAPSLTFAETAEYSEFLYGATNPITGIAQKLCIVPKSNVVNSDYTQPAQKAPITLKVLLDMLRNCFRCYWFVEGGKFRIEHISYFMNGGSYSGQRTVGRDLTQEVQTRNGKTLAYCTSKYTYDKPEMVGRYQFGWMDDVTQLFEGFPIDIVSEYVDKSKIEEVMVSQFTSDIDYILLNPADISLDGFVLLAAEESGGEYKLPYMTYILDFTEITLQNPWVAFFFLQRYYAYDMPAQQYEINGVRRSAAGVKKLLSQSISFPCFADPQMMSLIKTGLGFGEIEKISINLSSRQGKATLKYDAE